MKSFTTWFKNLPLQRKIEMISITVCTFIMFISAAFLIATNRPTTSANQAALEKLAKQRDILEKNSETLIKAVSDLNAIVKRNNIKDSIVSSLLSQQSNLIPNINTKLNEIDKNYKNIANISNFTSDEIRKYVSDEAKRVRNMPTDRGN